jgi:hypothetical protein
MNANDSSSANEHEPHHLEWDSTIDTLLADWCDEAKCFEWMHNESYSECDAAVKYYIILINGLTAFSGLSNVIVGGTSVNGFQLSWIFGGLSILVSTLNILQDKLGYAQNGSIHKRLTTSWAILISKIEEVILLPYSARQDCKTFLKYIKADMNQAKLDGSTLISKKIREACYKKFQSISGFNIPDICGQMEHTIRFDPKSSDHTSLLQNISIQDT